MTAGSSRRSAVRTWRIMRSASCDENPAVDGIRLAGDERGFVRAQVQRERRDFLRQAHPADGLVLLQGPAHFRLTSGVVRAQVALDERRLHAGRADAVAPIPRFT